MFPMINRQLVARHDGIITEKSRFTRPDFPPSAALFKAMRAKYGENFGLHRIPDTLAACWALVRPPNAYPTVEDGIKTQRSNLRVLQEEKISITKKLVAIEGLEASARGNSSGNSLVNSGLIAPHSTTIGGNEDDSGSLIGGEDQAQHNINDKPDFNIAEKELNAKKATGERELPVSQTTSGSTDEADDGRYRFPVNTFVCTLGRKHSQAPYFIKNSGDLFQLLQEMGMSSHIRKQRVLSTDNVGDI
ncbi:unnamed protein product [Peronospora destructor]|uniref:Uncharacterized protein n=1 Tax=Peronospora destructor TaxID=86335 RepID=A0AAV0UAY1_9STRA|nr:unnamed protein product [Peronospora destructor]